MKKPDSPYFHVVLLFPDIPQNTGNIGRLCLASGCELVLVRPLGFRLTDSLLLRAGMDYWEKLSPVVLDSYDEFLSWVRGRRLFFFSAKGSKSYASVRYQMGDVFCFGSESGGFPQEVLERGAQEESLVTLPMIEGTRCLNVSASAAVAVYEGLRQILDWKNS